MEVDPRSFMPVRLGIVNAETPQTRFENHHTYRSPAIAFWRVNLTALSQRYNLYFVATHDTIQVYRPSFPYQNLGGQPSLTIFPHLANPSAHGYIDRDRPHDINHILVGDLGNQEILLLSTDSGNVVAYHTHSINAAVKKDSYKFNADGNADFVGIRPFFSNWVYESAWGLAIHSEGRMIAVSANTPSDDDADDLSSKITVFAFALIGSDPGVEAGRSEFEDNTSLVDDGFDWKVWSTSQGGQTETPKRDCNYKIVLAGPEGHDNNIPCISFVNSPEDTMGSWLLSTDIKGQMKMWQIWKGKCFRKWNLASQGEPYSPWRVNLEAGWLVAALDANTFRLANSMEEFLGYHHVRQYYGHNAPGESFDLTDTVYKFTPQNSRVHPWLKMSETSEPVPDEQAFELNMDAMVSEDEMIESLSIQEHDQSPVSASPRPSPETTGSVDIRQRPRDADREMIMSMSEDESDEDFYEDPVDGAMEIEITGTLSDEEGDAVSACDDEVDHSPVTSTSATSDYSDNETFDNTIVNATNGFLTPPLSSPRRKRSKRKVLSHSKIAKQDHHIKVPSFPMIHCSTSHVRLFGGPDRQYPHVFCARMLKQTLPLGFENTNFSHLDRLSMVHQIPELGIILIATQLGRCAICTLTRRKEDGLLGFRVDWTLPTKKQERAGARPPNQALLGIAASPVQGRAGPKPITLSDDISSQEWSQDRIINGTRTSFDPEVVILDEQQVDRNHQDHGHVEDSTDSVYTERRQWNRPRQMDRWIAYQNSRTYRVMLTYTDMTVLTYEVGRAVENADRYTRPDVRT